MRELAERIIEAIKEANNTDVDAMEAVETVLNDWQQSQTKMYKEPTKDLVNSN